jgi:hypothetical protein
VTAHPDSPDPFVAHFAGDARDRVASGVTAAEADRTRVDQAVGMAMVQQGVDADQPLDRMRTTMTGLTATRGGERS